MGEDQQKPRNEKYEEIFVDDGAMPVHPGSLNVVVFAILAAIGVCLLLTFAVGVGVGAWSAKKVRASYAEAQTVMADQDKALRELMAACQQARSVYNRRIEECGITIAQTESRLALCRSFLESAQADENKMHYPTSKVPR